MASVPLWFWGLLLSELVSLVCLVVLWRRPDSIWKKLLWTAALTLPVVGPLLFGGLYEPPSVQPLHERAPFSDEPRGGCGPNGLGTID